MKHDNLHEDLKAVRAFILFFLWGIIRNRVYILPLPYDLPELRPITKEAIAFITLVLSDEVRKELGFRLDVYRITEGTHIEQ